MKVLNSPTQRSVEFDLRGLLRRVVEEQVEAEIRQVEEELAEAGRVGVGAEELAAVRDILYEDKWFRLELRLPSMPISRGSSPKMERRLKSSRRLRGAYSALGLKLSKHLC